MIIPTSVFGIYAVVTLVVPGLVYAAMRNALQGFGPQDKNVTWRLVEALMVSVLLDACYLLIAGNQLVEVFSADRLRLTHPRLVGCLTLGLCITAPAMLAYVRFSQAELITQVRVRLQTLSTRTTVAKLVPRTGYRAEPTAWDWIAPQRAYKFIRILNREGRWIGGWTTDDTFFSSYPEPRDVFIPEQWVLDETGEFVSKSEGTAGVWVSLVEAQLIEWIDPLPDDQREVVHVD